MKGMRPLLRLVPGLLVLATASAASAAPPDWLREFVGRHCVDCHGPTTAEANLRLDDQAFDLANDRDLATWIRVHDRVAAGEMPPAEAAQPTPEQRKALGSRLDAVLHEASRGRQRAEGRVALRRLSRSQHENTLNDLLGISISLGDVLPDDGSVAGFDSVSEALDTSSAHLLRFQEAADMALDAAIATRPPKQLAFRVTGKEATERHHGFRELLGKCVRLDGERLHVYIKLPRHISLQSAETPMRGRYRLKLVAQAVNTGDRPLPLEVQVVQANDRAESKTLATLDLPSEQPGVFELETMLDRHDTILINGWQLADSIRDRLKDQPLETYTGPGFSLEAMELEGPLEEFPPPSHKRLFGDLPLEPASVVGAKRAGKQQPQIPENRRDDDWRHDPLIPVSYDRLADGQRLLRDFLPRANRRPPDEATLAASVAFFEARLDEGSEFHSALRSTYKAILSSPHFFYFREKPGPLDDHALAARLSYFLWSTLPDEELSSLAGRGELHKPAVLRAQVERLLADDRSQRFIENFTGQWLELRKIDATTPDPGLYGEFDPFLQWSMVQETKLFFREMLRHDLGVAEVVHSDWTMLNARLAQHYGIEGVKGGAFRRVSLPPESHRGGVLTHASVLKVTADGTKTSPIVRGRWVLEKILGTPPAPPPPGIPAIEPDIRGATTIRQQLAKHQSIAACAACHKQIDPPGFALESFDVIGGWRDFYRSSDHAHSRGLVPLPNYPERQVWRGPDVEVGGTTAEGREFRTVDDYKALLLENKEQLARNLARQLLVFATGADVQYADRREVQAIVARARGRNYGLRSLVHEVTQSPVFLEK